MTQPLLKLVEPDETKLAALVREFAAKAEADRRALEADLAPVVDEIELALSIEHGEIEELRQLVREREAAALQQAVRIGRLLLRAKRKVPHGQWQEWIKEKGLGGYRTASEYMRLAKMSRRSGGR